MIDIYSATIIEACRNNDKDATSKSEKQLIIDNLSEYVSSNKIPVKVISKSVLDKCVEEVQNIPNYPNVELDNVFIEGIPFYSVIGAGLYFEMKPGVWRLVPTSGLEYDLYVSLLKLKVWYIPEDFSEIESSIRNVYGLDIFSKAICLLHDARCMCTKQGIINYLKHAIKANDYNTTTVQHHSALSVVPANCYFKSGLYVHTHLGWRYVVTNYGELKEYTNVLSKSKLLESEVDLFESESLFKLN